MKSNNSVVKVLGGSQISVSSIDGQRRVDGFEGQDVDVSADGDDGKKMRREWRDKRREDGGDPPSVTCHLPSSLRLLKLPRRLADLPLTGAFDVVAILVTTGWLINWRFWFCIVRVEFQSDKPTGGYIPCIENTNGKKDTGERGGVTVGGGKGERLEESSS